MLLGILSILLSVSPYCLAKGLETVVSWKSLIYEFPTEEDQQYVIQEGFLIPGNGNPIDVGVEYRENGERRIFVTIPRLTEGIPYSLAIVSPEFDVTDTLIQPYPSYGWHSSYGADCDGITSAVRIAIDQCNRLWVLDSGTIGTTSFCPPQLLVFDLSTDTAIHRHKFSRKVYRRGASRLMNLVTDVNDPPPKGQCAETKVYIADTTFHGLIVYDLEQNAAWRTDNKLMDPDPDFGTISVNKEKVDLMYGILGLSVTPHHFSDRSLYFNSLASETQNLVPLHILANRTAWEKNLKSFPREFVPIGRRGVQSTVQAMDSKGNVYCVTMDDVTLFKWNIKTPYDSHHFKVLADDEEQLEFATGIKVVQNPYGEEELWILTSRFQQLLTGSRNYNEINFRILACSIEDLNNWSSTCRVVNKWNNVDDYNQNIEFIK